MAKLWLAGVLVAMVLGGCQSAGPAPRGNAAAPAGAPGVASTAPASGSPHYRCDQGIEFRVRFGDDSAVLDAGPSGQETLLRDAGGATPQQTVYSNTRMRAEFGLGEGGREAVLRYAAPALTAHCLRD